MPAQEFAIDIDATQFSRTLRNAILLPVAVIVVTALTVLLLSLSFLHAMKNSVQSQEVELQAQTCEKSLLAVEADTMGYLLQGDPALLASFQPAVDREKVDFDKLRQLVARSRNLNVLEARLEEARDAWLQHARRSVEQRSAGKMPDADWEQMGRALHDRVRVAFRDFSDEEALIRDQRGRDLREMKLVLALAGVGLAILLAVTVGQIVRRQFSTLAHSYRQALQMARQRHTDLERSELDLERQKEWFRVTLTSIGDGVIVTDKQGRVVFLNHEAERLTGWTSVEALLQPLPGVFRLVEEETHAPLENPAEQVFRTRKTAVLPARAMLLSRQGHEWPIDDTVAPILDAGGGMLGVVVVFHDATAARETQRVQREHAAELERKVEERTATLRQAVADLEAFSYTVSHDLRSPLRSMQGFAQAVLEDYGEKIDAEGRDYLTRIRNAGERLDRLIQDLLSFTRLARQDVPAVPLDLDRLLRDIVEHYPNLHAPAAEVTIVGQLPRVLGQEAALTQVVSNLLGNAVKFVAPGTEPRIRVSAAQKGARVRVWIEDNGIGLDPKDAVRIFDMFVRADESKRYGGTGVGLAIVKKAVETMRGSVGVEPGESGGSRFWFELPCAPENQ